MATQSGEPSQDVKQQLKKRMLETGEWDRIYKALMTQLEEAGWQDDVKDLAKERVRAQETPNLQDLLKEVSDTAIDPYHVLFLDLREGIPTGMIPKEVHGAVLQEIRAVLEREVEIA